MKNAWRLFFFLLVLLLPLPASGDCDCASDEEDRDKKKTLPLKVASIISILVCGGIGVVLPVLGKWIPSLRLEKDVFFMIKAFAAGIILVTEFVHILSDAFETLLEGVWHYVDQSGGEDNANRKGFDHEKDILLRTHRRYPFAKKRQHDAKPAANKDGDYGTNLEQKGLLVAVLLVESVVTVLASQQRKKQNEEEEE